MKAEASGGVFSPSADDIKKFPLQIAQERNLYNTNRERLSSEISSLNDQYAQKKNEIIEVKGRMDQQKKSLQLTKEEVSITEPLVAQGIKPKVEFLRLQRSLAEVTAQYNSSADSLPRLNSAISEIGNKIKAARLDFASKAQTALNEAQTDYNRIGAETIALEDQVTRTSIKSPISGIVQKLYVNTIGGVVKPGDNLVEIVPTEGGLLIEAKVKPSDIAFIYPGQKAIIKVTAYDFSIYGSLEGKVVTISPDTVTDKNNNVYYSTFAHKT